MTARGTSRHPHGTDLPAHSCLNSGFHILNVSSHVVPEEPRHPFELPSYSLTDELVIFVVCPYCWEKEKKKKSVARLFDTLPVL